MCLGDEEYSGMLKVGRPAHMAQLSISVRGGQQCAARRAERMTLKYERPTALEFSTVNEE